MSTAALVDTNVLVYRFDLRFPEKQGVARHLLRRGIEDDSVRLAHQCVVEFVEATTQPLADGQPLLTPREARLEAEDLLRQFPVLYPDANVIRAAIRGMATYGFPWFDAHLWAYADVYGLRTLYSESFQHDRHYGTVRVVDPFVDA